MRLSHRASAWLHQRCRPLKRGLLEFRAAAYAKTAQRIPIRGRESTGPATLVEISKDASGSLCIAADTSWLRSRDGFSTAWRRLGVFVDLLASRSVPEGSWRADLADWVEPTGAVAGFCSTHTDTRLVPDRGFFRSAGYAKQRRLAAQATDWFRRRPVVVWRGGPNGRGCQSTATMDWQDNRLVQRIRLCLLGRQLMANNQTAGLQVDFRLSSVCRHDAAAATAMRNTGIVGPYIPSEAWLNHRFAIDIDGYANAFTNFFTRLLYGCCVLKVASPGGFRQWYYDRLIPWTHFVPIAADLTDLGEKIRWCAANPATCRRIAEAGQAIAFSMTYRSERQQAIERLAAAA